MSIDLQGMIKEFEILVTVSMEVEYHTISFEKVGIIASCSIYFVGRLEVGLR
jgi:hypothetical protein